MELKVSKYLSNVTMQARYNHYKQICKLNELAKNAPQPICELPLKAQYSFWKTLQQSYHIWSEFETHLAKHWNDETKLLNIETNLFYVYDYGDGDSAILQLGFTALAPSLFAGNVSLQNVRIEQALQWVLNKQVVLVSKMFKNTHFINKNIGEKIISEQEMLTLVNKLPLISFNGKTTPESYVQYHSLHPQVFKAFYNSLDLTNINQDILNSALALQREAQSVVTELTSKRTEINKTLNLAQKALKQSRSK